MKKAASIAIVMVTLTLCVAFIIYVLRREAGRTAYGAIELVKQALNVTPEVTVTTYVTHQKNTEILELASVSKEFPMEYTYTHTQYGSTKKLQLRGQYTVKAGFDLRERFLVQIDAKTREVHADFPPPKILSVEQNSYRVIEDENGLWNRLNQKDQETAVNQMNQRARISALEMGVCDEAKEALRRQLLELAKKSGQKWEIRFRDERQKIDLLQEPRE